jgi:hypothetical protein
MAQETSHLEASRYYESQSDLISKTSQYTSDNLDALTTVILQLQDLDFTSLLYPQNPSGNSSHHTAENAYHLQTWSQYTRSMDAVLAALQRLPNLTTLDLRKPHLAPSYLFDSYLQHLVAGVWRRCPRVSIINVDGVKHESGR